MPMSHEATSLSPYPAYGSKKIPPSVENRFSLLNVCQNDKSLGTEYPFMSIISFSTTELLTTFLPSSKHLEIARLINVMSCQMSLIEREFLQQSSILLLKK